MSQHSEGSGTCLIELENEWERRQERMNGRQGVLADWDWGAFGNGAALMQTLGIKGRGRGPISLA